MKIQMWMRTPCRTTSCPDAAALFAFCSIASFLMCSSLACFFFFISSCMMSLIASPKDNVRFLILSAFFTFCFFFFFFFLFLFIIIHHRNNDLNWSNNCTIPHFFDLIFSLLFFSLSFIFFFHG